MGKSCETTHNKKLRPYIPSMCYAISLSTNVYMSMVRLGKSNKTPSGRTLHDYHHTAELYRVAEPRIPDLMQGVVHLYSHTIAIETAL